MMKFRFNFDTRVFRLSRIFKLDCARKLDNESDGVIDYTVEA